MPARNFLHLSSCTVQSRTSSTSEPGESQGESHPPSRWRTLEPTNLPECSNLAQHDPNQRRESSWENVSVEEWILQNSARMDWACRDNFRLKMEEGDRRTTILLYSLCWEIPDHLRPQPHGLRIHSITNWVFSLAVEWPLWMSIHSGPVGHESWNRNDDDGFQNNGVQ